MSYLYLPKWSKLNKAGKAPVILRITVNGVRANKSTGIFTTLKQWNQAKEELRGSSVDVDTNNKTLSIIKSQALANETDFKKLIKEKKLQGPLTARMIADSLRLEVEEPIAPEPCALTLFTDLLTSHYAATNQHTYQHLCSLLTLLRRWRGTAPLPFSALVLPSTGTDLMRWCSENTGRGPAGKAALVAAIQSLWHRATGTKDMLWPDLSRTQARTSRRVRLTKEQLKTLREATGLTPAQRIGRLAYLLAFHLHGSRLGAVLQLQWAQVGEELVELRLEKGGGTAYIPINDKLRAILTECRTLHSGLFVLPLLPDTYSTLSAAEQHRIRKSKHACVGSSLKFIAEKLNLPQPLHPHTARHTAAKLITNAHGGDIRPANKLLRHTSLAMTEKYIGSMSDDELNAAADKMYNDL